MGRPKRTVIHDWPYLMKPATARAYLDGIPEAAFKALVTPHLARCVVAGQIYFTRESIDDWIESGSRDDMPRTPEDLMRMLDNDAG